MKYLDEFSEPNLAARVIDRINHVATRPWALMATCGGQSRSIIRHGIDELLPTGIEVIHGPGCPVCVTPLAVIDKALAIAEQPDVIFCSFGDALRIPGSGRDLSTVKSLGADVRVIYSPLDALALAHANPDKQIVLFGIGSEATAPANAMAVRQAKRQKIANFSMLASHILLPPAMAAVLETPACRVQALLAAGHVCSVMGTSQYALLAQRYSVPVVITGFEPFDLLAGIATAITQLEEGRHELENAYPRAVTDRGNRIAQELLADVFEVTDREWRGIGMIAGSGWKLSRRYQDFDAEHRFDVATIDSTESGLCRSGDVLQGRITPDRCSAFGKECTPRTPLGATMVSAEGACAAYYSYRRPELVGTT